MDMFLIPKEFDMSAYGWAFRSIQLITALPVFVGAIYFLIKNKNNSTNNAFENHLMNKERYFINKPQNIFENPLYENEEDLNHTEYISHSDRALLR